MAVGWLDYTQHCGFATDAARVRSPKDKPRVERAVQYVRGNFFAGEEFVDLADAQTRAEKWCRDTAGGRIHGSTQARPVEVFTEHEAPALLPVPEAYDVPIFTRVKVHRDFHVEVGKALYWAPRAYLGEHLDVRADSALVKLFCRGQLVKIHPRQRPGWSGHRSSRTCPSTRPATPCATSTDWWPPPARTGPRWGPTPRGCSMTHCPRPGCGRSTGCSRWPGATVRAPVNTACGRALALDVINVTKIASMLEAAVENTPTPLPPPVALGAARFARDPAEFAPHRPSLTLITGGETR